MAKKSKKTIKIRAAVSYASTDYYPEPGGPVGVRKPRRNYWGNLLDEDTYHEDRIDNFNYDYSDFDGEDDHDTYYNDDSYD